MSKEIIVERGTKTVYRERRLTTLWRRNPA